MFLWPEFLLILLRYILNWQVRLTSCFGIGGLAAKKETDLIRLQNQTGFACSFHLDSAHDRGEFVKGNRAGEIPPAVAQLSSTVTDTLLTF